MSRNSSEDINLLNVFELMSTYFEVTYNDLLSVLREETNYKRLLRIGEKQFFDAPTETSIEFESQKSRLCFAKINLLACDVDNDIDRIIQEKLQGDFLSTFKEKVLEAVLELYSKKNKNSQVSVPSSKSEKKIEEKVFEKNKDSSKYAAQDIGNTKKQMNEIPVEETGHSAVVKNKGNMGILSSIKTQNMDNDNHSDISFGSVSSVHTSDLSSFDDEIIISSDEEDCGKKKINLKEAQEKVGPGKSKRLESESVKDNDQVSAKNFQSESCIKSESSVNESSSVLQKSPRARKPNSKYSACMVLPYKRKSTENFSSKISTSSPARLGISDQPRKRGRPRKFII